MVLLSVSVALNIYMFKINQRADRADITAEQDVRNEWKSTQITSIKCIILKLDGQACNTI